MALPQLGKSGQEEVQALFCVQPGEEENDWTASGSRTCLAVGLGGKWKGTYLSMNLRPEPLKTHLTPPLSPLKGRRGRSALRCVNRAGGIRLLTSAATCSLIRQRGGWTLAADGADALESFVEPFGTRK